MKNLPVIFLMGATASGKTELAAGLFGVYDVELVSVDAAQVYRGMDIGTAKPGADFLRAYPHHLIDIREPDDAYCAAQFCDDARALIGEIHARGKVPILVGGSMFYFSALENGLSELPSADVATRKQLNDEIERDGLEAMYRQLQRIDPKLAATILPSDTQRIQRGMEIHRLSGRRPSEVMAQSASKPIPFALIKLGLFHADRSVLHARIEARFMQMLERGLVEEVKTIIAAIDNPEQQTCMRIVGYRQVHGFLRGELTHDEMIDKGIAATRQLAKRQLTWLRQQNNLVWVDVNDSTEARVRAYLNVCL